MSLIDYRSFSFQIGLSGILHFPIFKILPYNLENLDSFLTDFSDLIRNSVQWGKIIHNIVSNIGISMLSKICSEKTKATKKYKLST